MANEDSKLRIFLRNRPQPAKVRMRRGDDEEQEVALTENLRHRWRICEEACVSWGAEHVDCLDDKGKLLRTFTMPQEEPEGRSAGKGGDPHDYRGLAAVIDRIAERHNEAFDRGADSAARSQDQLVELVQLLAMQLAAQMTSNFNLSQNFAAMIQGKDPDDASQISPSQQAMAGLIGQFMGRAMANLQPDAAKPNGKG